ncbi:hypothetical protein MMD36_001344 [Acinetobacter baumannii]|nr:hypothetical protein [Acinetobacter baumannii]EHU3266098.1 hypothetical protein [Acinetobacter baumannii]EKV5599021.1 hypothetical protein [Acinetobacter baumannii]EKV5699900.1 hypothetical protein [Acinetobacter baumannii]EKV6849333.1 hypothetical protein [Acinetobacter baumannii]EKV6915155.1 hypothetical protein [Acinetobacter baumannii]
MLLNEQEEKVFEEVRQLFNLATIEEAIEFVIQQGIQTQLQQIAERVVQPRKS